MSAKVSERAEDVRVSVSELPKLEIKEHERDLAPLLWGDWLAMISPAMKDISSTSSIWWSQVVDAATSYYQHWLMCDPVARLSLQPSQPYRFEHTKYARVEQRALTMLLRAVPTVIKEELGANRKLSCIDLLALIHTTYQPGGLKERSALLRYLTNPDGCTEPVAALRSIKRWSRWKHRAAELHISTPDPTLLLGGVDMMVSKALALYPESQFRISSYRFAKSIDHQPTETKVVELVKFVQGELETLVASGTVRSKTKPDGDADAGKRLRIAKVEDNDAKGKGKSRDDAPKGTEGKGDGYGGRPGSNVDGDVVVGVRVVSLAQGEAEVEVNQAGVAVPAVIQAGCPRVTRSVALALIDFIEKTSLEEGAAVAESAAAAAAGLRSTFCLDFVTEATEDLSDYNAVLETPESYRRSDVLRTLIQKPDIFRPDTREQEVEDMETIERQGPQQWMEWTLRCARLHRALCHSAFLCEAETGKACERGSLQQWFEARRVLGEMQPATRQRQLALMSQLAGIRFDANRSLAEQIVKYEELIKEYERVSGGTYPDDLRISSVIQAAPTNLQTQLHLTMDESTDYKAIREKLLAYERSSTRWQPSSGFALPAVTTQGALNQGGPTDMEIDRVEKGKGGHKGGLDPRPWYDATLYKARTTLYRTSGGFWLQVENSANYLCEKNPFTMVTKTRKPRITLIGMDAFEEGFFPEGGVAPKPSELVVESHPQPHPPTTPENQQNDPQNVKEKQQNDPQNAKENQQNDPAAQTMTWAQASQDYVAANAAQAVEGIDRRDPVPRGQPEGAPDDAAVALHNLTHMPFASWCEACVRTRSRGDRHSQGANREARLPILQVDFYFASLEEGGERPNPEGEQENCILIGVDLATEEIVRFTLALHQEQAIIVQSDGEPAIKAVVRAVAAARARLGRKTVQSNRPAERTVQTIKRLGACMLLGFELQKGKLAPDTPLKLWSQFGDTVYGQVFRTNKAIKEGGFVGWPWNKDFVEKPDSEAEQVEKAARDRADGGSSEELEMAKGSQSSGSDSGDGSRSIRMVETVDAEWAEHGPEIEAEVADDGPETAEDPPNLSSEELAILDGAAVAGAWCRAPAAANQGAVTPVPAMPALAGRLAVLPAGQAQWVFQAAAPSVIFEAVADRQGLYTCFADGQAAEPEVGTARRYLGRPFWMVRLPPTVMKHLMEIGKEFVVPGGLVTSLGHQLPGTVPAAAEGSPSDGADSGSSSSCEMKKVRRPAMQEILLGKLAYKLSSTVGIQDVVRTVLRMLVPDSLGGGADKSLRIVRYISPDSSPQANYDYFCATEELLLYRSDELPRDAGGNVQSIVGAQALASEAIQEDFREFRMAHMADTCNKVFVAVIQQKLAYAQQVPWVFAAAFAGYMGETWGRVKKVLRPHLQNVDNMISSGQVGALDSVTHALFGPTDTGRMLREFLNSEDDVPLDRWPALFWRVQEYAFVSLSERHTEREHVGVKVAANRGLTKAGPAVVCSRKRRDQVLEMLEDEKQLAFLVNNWRSRRLWSSLLEHMLTHEEVRLMDTPKRLSRLYGYSEEDHFKDCEDSVRADAVYRQTLRDQTLLLAGSFKLPSASHQVVNWLKGHLATGVFFSVSTHVFELLVDRGRRCEDPAASFRTDVLLSILRADVHPRVSDRASVFCSVLDARPEARTDARVSRPAAHITDPKLGRRSCVVVQRFHDVDVSQGVHGLGGDVRVACTNVRIEVLDLARVCTAENLKAFCANCLLWRAMPAELALALGDESTQPGLLQEPQVQKLPEIVLDSDPACLLSRPPPDPHVEDALDILHPPAHVVQNADDSAVLQVYGAPCSDREMQAIKELLRARAIGIESAVYATDLEHFDAVALEGLRDRGLVICETDMFSDVSVALTGKLTYSASLVLARPLLLWELDQTTLTRGQMPGRSKLELIRLLFVLGWEPGLGREAWHRKQGEKRLPDDVLVCSLPFLRALMLSRLIWEKPGNLSGIYLKGPQQYYEFLVDQDDLSSLRDASAEEINARFAQKKKRPAGRSLTRDAATGLELDPEADDAELEELVQELPEKLMQAEEPQPSMASGGRRVAPLEIDLGGGGLLPFCLLGKCEQLTTAELKLTLRWVPVVYNQWGEAQLPHRPPALLPPHPPAAAAPFAGTGAAHGAATGGGVAANPSGAAAMPAPKKNPGQVDLSSEDDDEESEEEEAAKKDEDKEPDSQSRKDDIVVVDHDQEKKKEEKGGKKEEAAQKRKKKKESSSSSGGNSESSSKKEKPRAAPAAKEAKQAHEAQADENESGKAKEPKEDKEAEAAEGEPAARPARKNRSRHSADEADVVRCEHCWMCVKKEGLQSHLENSEYCRQWRLHAAGQNVAGQKPAEEQASSGACQCRHCSRQFMRRWDMLQHCLGTHPNSDEAKECLQAMHNKRKKQPSKEDRAASMSQHRPPVQLRSRGRVEEPPHRRGPRREESRDDDGSRGRRRSRGESRQSRGQASSRGGGQASSRGSRKGGGQASSRGSRKSSRGSEHMDRRFSGRSRSRRAGERACGKLRPPWARFAEGADRAARPQQIIAKGSGHGGGSEPEPSDPPDDAGLFRCHHEDAGHAAAVVLTSKIFGREEESWAWCPKIRAILDPEP
ncbi:unnamed protein product [Symbiodinium sp. CCMP2592]|nr:unnamed protein product [Symbiodinium sp. CCMP2592]